jgi:CheY-like chemotaxis protein
MQLGGLVSRRGAVLIAEDHAGNRLLVRQLLELEGFTQVDAVSTGLDAVAAWERGTYDLLLLDWQMPGLDGLEALRRIRSLESEFARLRTAIVMVTGRITEPERAACFAAGADECVAKPYRPEELLDAMDRALRSLERGGGPAADLDI